jgi:hypothetical protein
VSYTPPGFGSVVRAPARAPSFRLRVPAAALVLALLPSAYAAAEPTLLPHGETEPRVEPPTHLLSPSHVVTRGGSELDLPEGYFVPEETWDHLDLELRRLQESETRLRAENEAFRRSAGWGWGTVALVVGAVAVGAGGVLWIEHR